MTITLRPFTEPEYHLFFQKYESDPLMEPVPYIYNQEAVSRSYEYNYKIREHYAHYGIFLDSIIPVGCFQLKRMDMNLRHCEMGIILQKEEYKNQGIGTNAVFQGMLIARNDFSMKKMYGDTASRNYRMRRVFEKLGFDLIETVPNAFLLIDGRPDDRLIYERDLTELDNLKRRMQNEQSCTNARERKTCLSSTSLDFQK